jgi:hypothetical protein
VLRASPRSDRYLERDLTKDCPWNFDLPFPFPMFLAHSDKAIALEELQVSLYILQVAVEHLCQFIYRTGALGPDRAQESKTVGREQVAGSLHAREIDSFTFANPATCLGYLEGVLEVFEGLTD